MLATLAFVFGGFVLLVLRSYRRAARVEGGYRPEGKLRWTDGPPA